MVVVHVVELVVVGVVVVTKVVVVVVKYNCMFNLIGIIVGGHFLLQVGHDYV